MHAATRAVALVPCEPSPERATVLATLAQLKMLDGIFTEAQRLALEAIRVARACDPVARAQEIHATTSLAVALAWGSDPNRAIDLLRDAERSAQELEDPDALFRIRANLTTVLDLVGRRGEAVDVAYAGIEDAKRAGLEAVYGNFLAGNAAESLYFLGRWQESRDVALRAMSWLPVGVVYLAAVLQLAVVEIETDAGADASRLLGQTIMEFYALREPQLAGLYYLAAASFALWRNDIADASRSVDRGWESVRETEEWILASRMAAMVARVDAAIGAEARENRLFAPLAAARQRTANVLREATELVEAGGAPSSAGSRRVAGASLSTARAYQRRLEGEDSPAAWRRVAAAWAALDAPYDVALAQWRQAEAVLGSGRRTVRPLQRAGSPAGVRPARRQLGSQAAPARVARAGRSGADPVAAGGRRPACRRQAAIGRSRSRAMERTGRAASESMERPGRTAPTSPASRPTSSEPSPAIRPSPAVGRTRSG